MMDKKKTLLFVLPVLLVLTLAGVSKISAAPPTRPDVQAIDPAYDQEFIDFMVPNHQAGIQMMRLTLQRTTRPELRQFLTQQIASATRENQMMLEWREEWFGSRNTPPITAIPLVPETPGYEMGFRTVNAAPMLANLKAAPANKHELVFIEYMIKAHSEAVYASLITRFHSEHARTDKLARQMAVEHQAAIDTLSRMRDEWFLGVTLPMPTPVITQTPTTQPTGVGTISPTVESTVEGTGTPTFEATVSPTVESTEEGTGTPTFEATVSPTVEQTETETP